MHRHTHTFLILCFCASNVLCIAKTTGLNPCHPMAGLCSHLVLTVQGPESPAVAAAHTHAPSTQQDHSRGEFCCLTASGRKACGPKALPVMVLQSDYTTPWVCGHIPVPTHTCMYATTLYSLHLCIWDSSSYITEEDNCQTPTELNMHGGEKRKPDSGISLLIPTKCICHIIVELERTLSVLQRSFKPWHRCWLPYS